MKLINIYPVNNLELYERQEMNMFLAHLVLKYPDYAEMARNHKGYKILDNSLIELGDSMDLDLVLKAAEMIDADEVVLPDAFKDAKLSRERTLGALEKYKEELKNYKTMAVVHGKDEFEIAELFIEYLFNSDIDVIGFPKVWTEQFTLRKNIVDDLFDVVTKIVNIEELNKEFHLLGIWESFLEFNQSDYEYRHLIRSVDSSLAPLYDIKGIESIEYIRRNNEIIDLENDVMLSDSMSREAVKYVERTNKRI